jgi:hypothetical protein
MEKNEGTKEMEELEKEEGTEKESAGKRPVTDCPFRTPILLSYEEKAAMEEPHVRHYGPYG